MRLVALVATLGFVPALVGPALASNADAPAAMYGEWMRAKLADADVPQFSQALDTASEGTARSLSAFC